MPVMIKKNPQEVPVPAKTIAEGVMLSDDFEPLQLAAQGIPQEAFDTNILNKEYHERLLADLDRLTEVARIPKPYVWSRLSDYCTEPEVEWVRNMRHSADSGLAYIGKKKVPVENKMMAIVGACLRNYIDARLLTIQDVVTGMKNDNMPSPTVLLIPNFSMNKANGGDIPQWQVAGLLSMLYTRLAQEKKTVLFVDSMTNLQASYGEAFKRHLEVHYVCL